MPLRWVPWLVGSFMLTPFIVWFALATFVFPGAWNGFDTAVSTGALGATLPLAAWFFMRGLGEMANGMSGADPHGPIVHRLPRVILNTLPYAALGLGIAGAAYVVAAGEGVWSAAIPLGVGLMVAPAIALGERRAAWRTAGEAGSGGDAFARTLRALRRVPVLREIILDAHGERGWFFVNLVLVAVLAAGLSGASVPAMTIALLLVPITFVVVYVWMHSGGRGHA